MGYFIIFANGPSPEMRGEPKSKPKRESKREILRVYGMRGVVSLRRSKGNPLKVYGICKQSVSGDQRETNEVMT